MCVWCTLDRHGVDPHRTRIMNKMVTEDLADFTSDVLRLPDEDLEVILDAFDKETSESGLPRLYSNMIRTNICNQLGLNEDSHLEGDTDDSE